MAGATNVGICKPLNPQPVSFTPFDYDVLVKMGLIPGIRDFTVFGINSNLNANDGNTDIWPIDGVDLIIPSAPGLVTVSSTSNNDTAAGTGAQQIIAFGLNNGVEVFEVIPTNGIVGNTGIVEMDFINNFFISVCGATKKNQGDIQLTIAGTAGIQRFIPALVAFDSCSQQKIPAGKTALIAAVTISIDTNSGQGSKTALITGVVETGGVEREVFKETVTTAGLSVFQQTFKIYADAIPENSIIRFKADSDDNSITVRSGYAVRLVDNNYTL